MRRPKTKSNPAPASAPVPVLARSRFPVWLMPALLVLVTIGLYWPATRCDFVNYDDNLVVTSNVHVQNGLTLDSIKWAFFNPDVDSGYWQPLTVLSHVVDCQLFGLRPWGHHLTNVLLHALNTVLIFLLLRRLTGALWRSALVAAVFGLHPLHVESVAWVAERKGVLSTCFGLLTLIFYTRYAQRVTSETRPAFAELRRGKQVTGPGKDVRAPFISLMSRVTCHVSLYYWLALFFLALGLMSKPMLVTWPFVLLLLDYWPLERFKSNRAWLLVAEKIPFFALMIATSIVTFAVMKHESPVAPLKNLTLDARGGNALISYCLYLGKLFWPADLAVFYPHPGHRPLAQVLLAGGLLLGLTVLFIVKRRRYPFLLMGWLWFVGTLVPVIQLLQTGSHAMADRYAYIPSLGVLILAIWGTYEVTCRWRYQVMASSVAGCVAIVLCLGTRHQLGYWRDSETLFRHALEVTENNWLAHNNLGNVFDEKGQIDEAASQYREAIRLKPDYAEAHYNLGNTLCKKGQTDEAISQYQEALRLKPDLAEAHNNLGTALYRKGQTDEPISQYREAIRLKPDLAEAHYNLGNTLGRKGQTDEAISQYQEALRLKPDYAEARSDLGSALGRKGQIDEAINQCQKALRLNPDDAKAHNNLGAALYRKGQTDEAINQFQEALRLKPDFAEVRSNLGAALCKKGQIDEAINQFQEALRLNPDDAVARNNLAHALEMKNAPAGR